MKKLWIEGRRFPGESHPENTLQLLECHPKQPFFQAAEIGNAFIRAGGYSCCYQVRTHFRRKAEQAIKEFGMMVGFVFEGF